MCDFEICWKILAVWWDVEPLSNLFGHRMFRSHERSTDFPSAAEAPVEAAPAPAPAPAPATKPQVAATEASAGVAVLRVDGEAISDMYDIVWWYYMSMME